jgi:hypothetical protein
MATRIRGAIEATRQRNRTQKNLASQEESIRIADSSLYQSPHINPFKDTSRDNYRTYPYDYYAGTDCKVFYGDIWVDDIVSIQYAVSQNKSPIYGYASQNYDAVAKGHILVEGTMTIAFKEVGYLNLIQKVSETQKSNAKEVIKRRAETLQAKADYKLAKFDPSLTYFGEGLPPGSQINASYTENGSPQLIRQSDTIEEILLGMKASQSLTKTFGLNEKDRDFEDFAEVLEDSIWGDSNSRPLALRNQLKRADEFDYNYRGGITVGRGQGDLAKYSNCLNIMLTFGDLNDYRAEHTIVLLNDVHFTSSSMIVTPDGTPVAENYTFFARDINKSLSTEMFNINPIKLNVGLDDVEIAKLEDIDVIEQKLNQAETSTPWILTVKIIAGFNEFGWKPIQSEEIEVSISMDKGTPLVDRMITSVERAMNDTNFSAIVDTKKSQYIIDAWFFRNKNITVDVGGDKKVSNMSMVLEQGIPNTRTYRVIAPVRTGFRAPVIYTRDDLYSNIKDLPHPSDEVASILNKNKNYLDIKEAEYLSAKAELDERLGLVGTEDEEKRLDKARKAEERARGILDSAIEEGDEDEIKKAEASLALSQKRVARRQTEFDLELDRDLKDRDLNREAKDKLHDINREYAIVSYGLNSLIEDVEINNNNYEIYAYNKSIELDMQATEEANRLRAQREAQEEQEKTNALNRLTQYEAEDAGFKNSEEYLTSINAQIADIDAQILAANNELSKELAYGKDIPESELRASFAVKQNSQEYIKQQTDFLTQLKTKFPNYTLTPQNVDYVLDAIIRQEGAKGSNVGNIRDSKTGVINPNAFPDKAAGREAIKRQITGYPTGYSRYPAYSYGSSVVDIIATYAPPSENDTATYAKNVISYLESQLAEQNKKQQQTQETSRPVYKINSDGSYTRVDSDQIPIFTFPRK